MKKKMMVGILSTVMVMSMSITAFAGQWQSECGGIRMMMEAILLTLGNGLTETMMVRQKAITLIRKVIA